MLLGDKPIGSTVVFNINGEPVEFLIVHKGLPSEENYDKSCSGVWCLSKYALWKASMNANSSSSAYNNYAKTTINTYLNTTFLESFDQEVQEQIKEVKIPYYSSNSSGGGSLFEGENGLTVKIFFLSGKEVGFTELTGAKLDYFSEGTYKIDKVAATADGTTAKWWTRDRNGTSGNNLFITVNQAGTKDSSANWSSSPSVWARPAFILPFDFPVPDDEPETDMPPSSALCYIIKTAETAGEACGGGKVYSVKETRIGTWIDGKPLYQRYFEGTTSGNTYSWQIIAQIPDIKLAVEISAFILEKYNDHIINICSPSASIGFTPDTGIDMFITNADWVDRPVYGTAIYTKTTD